MLNSLASKNPGRSRKQPYGVIIVFFVSPDGSQCVLTSNRSLGIYSNHKSSTSNGQIFKLAFLWTSRPSSRILQISSKVSDSGIRLAKPTMAMSLELLLKPSSPLGCISVLSSTLTLPFRNSRKRLSAARTGPALVIWAPWPANSHARYCATFDQCKGSCRVSRTTCARISLRLCATSCCPELVEIMITSSRTE